MEVDEDESLVDRLQTIAWFDLEGKIAGQQAESELEIPLDTENLEQIQNLSGSIRIIYQTHLQPIK